jgi:hypothetical protein
MLAGVCFQKIPQMERVATHDPLTAPSLSILLLYIYYMFVPIHGGIYREMKTARHQERRGEKHFRHSSQLESLHILLGGQQSRIHDPRAAHLAWILLLKLQRRKKQGIKRSVQFFGDPLLSIVLA